MRLISSKITLAKEKERRIKLRGGEEEERRRRETNNGCILFFIMATLETEKRKTVYRRGGIFGANVFKNPARDIQKKLIFSYLVFQLLKSTKKGC